MITADGQIAVAAGAGAGAVNGSGGIVDHGRTVSTGDDTGITFGIGISTAVEGHGHTGGNILSAAQSGCTGHGEGMSKGMVAGNTQISVSTAVDIGRNALITHSRVDCAGDTAGVAFSLGIGPALEGHGNTVSKCLDTADQSAGADFKVIGKGMSAIQNQGGVVTADHVLTGGCFVGNFGGISVSLSKDTVDVVITAEDRTVVSHAAVENKICTVFTGEDRSSTIISICLDGERTVNGQSVSEIVAAVDGQVVVFTAVDISCCSISDISAVDFAGDIIFGIGHAAEDHFTVDNQFC